MAIEAVLFDYSGVLTTALQLPTENVPYDPDKAMIEMIAGLAGTDDHPWHQLERGEITLAEFITFAEGRVPGIGVLFAVDSEHNAMATLRVIGTRMTLAADLKAQGLRVGVVSNNVAEWESFWRPTLPQGLFEIVIDSAEVGCRKPEPAIYALALEQLAITDASTVLFIDDFEWNVTGAEAAGMTGLHCVPDIDLAAAVSALIG